MKTKKEYLTIIFPNKTSYNELKIPNNFVRDLLSKILLFEGLILCFHESQSLKTDR